MTLLTHHKQTATMPDLVGYCTTAEAAEELQFHINHVRRMIRRGDLKTKRVGQMLFVSLDSIKQYQEKTKGFDKHSPLKREKITKGK